jgi:poly(hydroxyalkanoate) depolymerase family esterase
MRRTRTAVVGLAVAGLAASAVVTVAVAQPASASAVATLTQVTDFGYNPTSASMYEYVPTSVRAHPAILVAAHWCTGSGPDMYNGTEFASFADQYGFIVIYPSANRDGKCWDVASDGALTHNGNSDPAAIRSMVKWAVRHHGADANRVYVTGISSGAMLTNVLLGDYPDVFKAGAAFMGVPFYCFYTGTVGGWNNDCSTGNITKTPQEWGDLVRAAYPGYTGPRPRMQLWHGTLDEALNYHNLGEEIKQWTNVLGVSQKPRFTDQPAANWTRTRYGATGPMAPVEANSFEGVGHWLPQAGQTRLALEFLGLLPPSSTSP